jgi:hypothetical protein
MYVCVGWFYTYIDVCVDTYTDVCMYVWDGTIKRDTPTCAFVYLCTHQIHTHIHTHTYTHRTSSVGP